ncbi:hypothetical protein PAXINDRAFT_182690 [Paxillus involutus ATCC 200175]|uniref:Unplaced genomic scaffold PAXINscaffold_1003, whole genome shotgun sequence n=1 Tax=Paxillus involutus ATCC 200175 TaxID=664439 RepID=A0A0C9SMM6_PAXIN|nr:hypothetical protein PAXINDRAFT_182690 [Paxillus involutus ATCC 200175]
MTQKPKQAAGCDEERHSANPKSPAGSTVTLGERLRASDGAKESVPSPPGTVWLESSESMTIGESAGDGTDQVSLWDDGAMVGENDKLYKPISNSNFGVQLPF